MSDNTREIFAKNLSYFLDLRGKSQIDVSRDLDVATGTVSSWVNGAKFPRVDKIQALADYLGVRMSILIEENGIAIFAKEEEERQLLSAYRAADPKIRAAALRMLMDSASDKKDSVKSAI